MHVAVLGVVGAGQLARMTYQAVIGLPVHLRVLARTPDDSAALVVPDVVVGDANRYEDLLAFAAGCDVVTFDHELVDPPLLRALAGAGHRVQPAPEAKLYAQDKLYQRRQLAALGLPVPPFAPVVQQTDVAVFAAEHGWPVVVKAQRGGYDGRGVWVVGDEAHAAALWAQAGGRVELLVEEHVPIVREVAVLIARRPGGEAAAYPVVETVQRDGMLAELLAPAPLTAAESEAAVALARRVADAVGVVGLVAVELFATPAGFVVNELALRPHNSGHWTIEGAATSQFANHVRGVLDWPLGSTTPAAPVAVTVNVLGGPGGADPAASVPAALALHNVHVHLYGKEPRPGRKLGHVTALGVDVTETRSRAWQAASLLSPAVEAQTWRR